MARVAGRRASKTSERVKEEVKPYLANGKVLDLTTLRSWLWEAACKIRGPVDAPKYKDYILPLIFLKRISDVFEDEVERLAKVLDTDLRNAAEIAESDHGLVRFFLPQACRWSELIKARVGLGQRLTDAMRAFVKQNPELSGVLDTMDFNATAAGQRIVEDSHLAEIMQVLNKHRLGLYDVQPDLIGDAYEYLLAKFAEGSGQSAGEFYTPRQVARLMAKLLEIQPGMSVYDPCCGSFSLLIKAHYDVLHRYGKERSGNWQLPPDVPPVRLYGQETLPSTFAMAKMNAFIHQVEASIEIGDTMKTPKFLESDGSLMEFERVTANPMWNQSGFDRQLYENDSFGRFAYGAPPAGNADWGWIQHMLAHLSPSGRLAVVLDTGSVARGTGNVNRHRERDIRKKVIEAELVSAVIQLPENLFYNNGHPAVIILLDKSKKHQGETILIDASGEYERRKPKNYLTEEGLERIAAVVRDRMAVPGFSRIVTTTELCDQDYCMTPSAFTREEAIFSFEEYCGAGAELREGSASLQQSQRNLEDALIVLESWAQADASTFVSSTLVPLGDVCRASTGGTPDTKRREYYEGGDVPWMTSADINQGIIRDVPGRITKLGLAQSAAKLVPAGSVAVALAGRGKTRGMTALLQLSCATNQSVATLVPNESVLDPVFLFFSLRYRYRELRSLTGDKDRSGLNLGHLRRLRILLPPVDIQRNVSTVLLSMLDAQQQALFFKRRVAAFSESAAAMVFSRLESSQSSATGTTQ